MTEIDTTKTGARGRPQDPRTMNPPVIYEGRAQRIPPRATSQPAFEAVARAARVSTKTCIV